MRENWPPEVFWGQKYATRSFSKFSCSEWYSPQRNAQVGDTVLLKDKNNHRLLWSTGTITSVTTDKDGLVRRVMVQPHKQQDQAKMPQVKERAIHDLVLLKAINAKDNPVPDCTTSSNTPSEAKVLLTSTAHYDREMFCNDPTERPKATYTNKSSPCSLQTPKQLIERLPINEEQISTIQNSDKCPNALSTDKLMPCSLQTPEQLIEQSQLTEKEIAALQNVADAFSNKIDRLRRQAKLSKLNPEAAPFNPSVFNTKAKTRKKLRWKIDLIQIHNIEPNGKQKPTSTENALHNKKRSDRRDLETNRTKRYRDQLTDVVTTLHQLSAKNGNVYSQCSSPQSFYRPTKTPRPPTVFKILQRPHNIQEDKIIRTPRMPDPGRPLEQRLAEYTQHRSRIYGYKLKPGIFNFSFMPP